MNYCIGNFYQKRCFAYGDVRIVCGNQSGEFFGGITIISFYYLHRHAFANVGQKQYLCTSNVQYSMFRNNMKKIVYIFIATLTLVSCANRGVGPQGGPKDETPPMMLLETPANGSVNVRPRTIEIAFNEYVQLDKVSENVLISPPQQRPPKVTAVGKRVRVEFEAPLDAEKDSAKMQAQKHTKDNLWLLDSTTYTIQFGSAICDYTEKNPIEDYTFAFSTGPVIDTMMIGGLMLNAEDLNPISGITVGLHPVYGEQANDTLFTTTPFERIGRTDVDGYFSIVNMKHGDYHLYGLNDVSRDYIYQPGEGIALYDSIVTPHCYRDMVTDSIWRDSISEVWTEGVWVRDTITLLDTVITREATIFEPFNLLLTYFQEDKQRHYFSRVLREKQHFFTLYFAAPQDSLPVIRPLSPRADSVTTDTAFVDWLPYTMLQTNPTHDTITYWLTDSLAISQDTLMFEMRYMKSDSLYQLQPQIDTIRAIYRAPRISEKAKAKMAENKQQTFVEVKTNAQSSFEIYHPLEVRFATPVKQIEVDSLHFYQVVDTIQKPIAFTFTPADSSYMRYVINHPWEASAKYELVVDSAAFRDIYDNVNNRTKASLTIRSLEEYSTLRVKVEPFDTTVMIQVLDEKDQPIRTERATSKGTLFKHLAPKSYYLRMFLDKNGDGKWTTGDYLTRRQPEPVFYFSNKLTLRANWDFEETFRYLDKPIEDQKPQELRKDASEKKK